MVNKNKQSTRYFSDMHEKSVCKALQGHQQLNSGAGKFSKGDVVIDNPSFLIECKTCMKDKDSFSLKKEWFEKNKDEAFSIRKENQCICFNFGPEQKNYYVISEKLMKLLIEYMRG